MTVTASETDNERLARYYDRLVSRYGSDVRAVDWGSRESQQKRFEMLAAVAPLDGATVLDVGCGLGDFLVYLVSKGVAVRYTGCDVSPRMVAHCRRRFPHTDVNHGDPLQGRLPGGSFDYVFASGIFSVQRNAPQEYLQLGVERMYRLCRIAIAFNSLSGRAAAKEPDEFHSDPAALWHLCRKICPRVMIRHDYLPHDVTAYLYKSLP